MISIRSLGKREAVKEWNRLQRENWRLEDLSQSYAALRGDLETMFNELKDSGVRVRSYEFDIKFAVRLYRYFSEKGLDSMRTVANDGFWRYLSLVVVPHLLRQRWAKNDGVEAGVADHFYSKPSRVWLKTLWWYVYLSWQGSLEKTAELLSEKRFTTDTIENLVERTGREGTNIELYRTIMGTYAGISVPSNDNFRKVMKMNTVKSTVVEPSLYEGGVQAYVDSIIDELGIR